MPDPCDACSDPVRTALGRTIRLSVDNSPIDELWLCPDCFASWIDRYEAEMIPDPNGLASDTDIIVD